MKYSIYILMIMGLLLGQAYIGENSTEEESTYKCLVQMTNYEGEGPYFTVSVLDGEGAYLETLHVSGEDEEWYPDIEEWWAFMEKEKPDVDAITRPSVPAGGRAVFVMDIAEELIDAGNQLRFETAVEDQKYVKDDLLIPLSTENLSGKFEGTGYIRYVRIIPNT